MLKCIATGMVKCKVQATREKNKIKTICLPGSVSSLSLLSCNIIPRECSNITCTVSNWTEVDKKRKCLYGDSVFQMNFTQFSNVAKPDTLLLWDLAVKIFPDAKLLSVADRQAIHFNFFPRWMMLDSAIGFCSSYEESLKYINSKDYTDMLLHFYGTSMSPEKRLRDDQIIETFKPFWDFHYYETAVPIFFKKLDKIEYMAIFLLLLFDDAYANISEEGATLCRNLRKVIKRELKGYQTDNNCSEMRFIDTMDTLLLLEKAEEKITAEVLICGVNNINLNDDFKAIFHVKKI
uniref:NR LBD domain-containing protein n=2 Tax=Caenorhabditis tropicalis TaxID=1561998 RepID=A0A1I7T9L2_9PELO